MEVEEENNRKIVVYQRQPTAKQTLVPKKNLQELLVNLIENNATKEFYVSPTFLKRKAPVTFQIHFLL